MATYPSVRPAVGSDDRPTWTAPRRTTQARSLQTSACALVSCQNSFAVLSNARRTWHYLNSGTVLEHAQGSTASHKSASKPTCGGSAAAHGAASLRWKGDWRRQAPTALHCACGRMRVACCAADSGEARSGSDSAHRRSARRNRSGCARSIAVCRADLAARRGNGSSMCQSHILCGSTCTHGGDDTRGAGREPQLPRANGGLSRSQPAGAYNSCTQSYFTESSEMQSRRAAADGSRATAVALRLYGSP